MIIQFTRRLLEKTVEPQQSLQTGSRVPLKPVCREFPTKSRDCPMKIRPQILKNFKFLDRNRTKWTCHLKVEKEGFPMLLLPFPYLFAFGS